MPSNFLHRGLHAGLGALLLAAGPAGPVRAADNGMYDALAKLPPTLNETFSDPTLAATWRPDLPKIWAVEGGRLQTATQNGAGSTLLHTQLGGAEIFFEADCEIGDGAAGLLAVATPDLAARSGGSAIFFSVRKEGSAWQYSARRRIRDLEEIVVPWTNTKLIRSAKPRLAILCFGGLIQFYANGQLLWEDIEGQLTAGLIGFHATAAPGRSATHAFDNVVVKMVSRGGETPTPPTPTPPVVKPVPPAPAPAPTPPVVKPTPPAPAPAPAPAPTPTPEPPKREVVVTAEPVKPVPPPAPAVVGPEVVPAGVTASDDRSPIIRPGLLIRTTVFVAGKREIDGEVKRVSDNNQIDLPLVGKIAVGGLNLSDLNSTLLTRYSEYFINPQVVAEFVVEDTPDSVSPWGSVVVLGRVKKAGRVNIPPTQDLRLSTALQMAGGFDTSAKSSEILVTRPKADGKPEKIFVDFDRVAKKGDLEKDILLQPGDQIFVPERVW